MFSYVWRCLGVAAALAAGLGVGAAAPRDRYGFDEIIVELPPMKPVKKWEDLAAPKSGETAPSARRDAQPSPGMRPAIAPAVPEPAPGLARSPVAPATAPASTVPKPAPNSVQQAPTEPGAGKAARAPAKSEPATQAASEPAASRKPLSPSPDASEPAKPENPKPDGVKEAVKPDAGKAAQPQPAPAAPQPAPEAPKTPTQAAGTERAPDATSPGPGLQLEPSLTPPGMDDFGAPPSVPPELALPSPPPSVVDPAAPTGAETAPPPAAAPSPAAAPAPAGPPTVAGLLASGLKGPAEVPLGNGATLWLPAGRTFLPAALARQLAELVGQTVDPATRGVVAPSDGPPWLAYIERIDETPKRDAAKAPPDPEKLLGELKALIAPKPETARPAAETVHWARPPEVGPNHRLTGCIDASVAGAPVTACAAPALGGAAGGFGVVVAARAADFQKIKDEAADLAGRITFDKSAQPADADAGVNMAASGEADATALVMALAKAEYPRTEAEKHETDEASQGLFGAFTGRIQILLLLLAAGAYFYNARQKASTFATVQARSRTAAEPRRPKAQEGSASLLDRLAPLRAALAKLRRRPEEAPAASSATPEPPIAEQAQAGDASRSLLARLVGRFRRSGKPAEPGPSLARVMETRSFAGDEPETPASPPLPETIYAGPPPAAPEPEPEPEPQPSAAEPEGAPVETGGPVPGAPAAPDPGHFLAPADLGLVEPGGASLSVEPGEAPPAGR